MSHVIHHNVHIWRSVFTATAVRTVTSHEECALRATHLRPFPWSRVIKREYLQQQQKTRRRRRKESTKRGFSVSRVMLQRIQCHFIDWHALQSTFYDLSNNLNPIFKRYERRIHSIHCSLLSTKIRNTLQFQSNPVLRRDKTRQG